jgi:orotidine-5'-phosphate decarboxylase
MVHLAWPFLSSRQSEVRQRLIFALDVASMAEVKEYVSLLKDEVGLFKVGKQLFLHGGPQVVRFIQNKGGEVFLDLKFHDIPRTVARTGVEATRLGVRMFDLHASGSSEMMHQTLVDVNKVCKTESLRRPKILAVTVLTSLNKDDLNAPASSPELRTKSSASPNSPKRRVWMVWSRHRWKSPAFAENAVRICC